MESPSAASGRDVVETTPPAARPTASSNSPKPAKLETGVTIIPAFVKKGTGTLPSTGNYILECAK